jgi:hypothetical protein
MATGLLRETGELIPIIQALFLRLTPVLRCRELQCRLATIELDRGGSVLTAGRRLLGTGAGGERVAAVLEAAAAEAVDASPQLAAELLAGAVTAGRAGRDVAGRRARAAALAGDLDGALRHADQVIGDAGAADRALAVDTAAAVLAHRGLPTDSAELYRSLSPSAALLGVPALVATGALDDAHRALGRRRRRRRDAGRHPARRSGDADGPGHGQHGHRVGAGGDVAAVAGRGPAGNRSPRPSCCRTPPPHWPRWSPCSAVSCRSPPGRCAVPSRAGTAGARRRCGTGCCTPGCCSTAAGPPAPGRCWTG